MIYALDSNTISFLLRSEKNQDVAKRFEDEIVQQGNYYVIPPISHYEVYWHLLRKKATAQLRIFNELYADSLTKINISEAELIKAAEIRADLEERGLPIGDADILIAAHCLINGYILVTDNVDDFERIEGLQYVNWKSRKFYAESPSLS
jgi:tRNA(fMet)-specific endonuclease VapC